MPCLADRTWYTPPRVKKNFLWDNFFCFCSNVVGLIGPGVFRGNCPLVNHAGRIGRQNWKSLNFLHLSKHLYSPNVEPKPEAACFQKPSLNRSWLKISCKSGVPNKFNFFCLTLSILNKSRQKSGPLKIVHTRIHHRIKSHVFLLFIFY